MPEFSPLAILYICIHLISLCLLSILVYIILKTGSYITKWTLFQLCICLFILGLSSLPTIIMYGDSLQERALDSPLCIIQNKIITFIYCPLKFLPVALCIYLWFAVARFNYNLEQKYFWYLSGLIWAITIFVNVLGFRGNSKQKNWGVQTGSLFCESVATETEWFGYIIPTSALAIITVMVTVHSSYILWGRWRNFNQKQNRRTAIDLGYAVRLNVLSCCYSVILLVSIIPSIDDKINHKSEVDNGIKFLDFAPSFFGTMLFMIFGTTKSATIFLPCCYYIPPDDRKKQRSIIIFSNTENSSMGPPLHEFIQLDVISRPAECPKTELTFDTVSTRVTIPENYEVQQ